MNIRPNPRRSKAFTIVEVIISVTIIGIAAAGLMACFTNSFFIMRMARENQRATQIMMERAEALRVFSWQQITNTVATNGVQSLPVTFHDWYTPSGTTGTGAYYQGYITNFIPTLGGVVSGYNTNMREVDITVVWTTDGVARSRTMTTFVARDGMQNYVY